MDNADLILKYKQLLDEGIISQEEFEQKRNELLMLPETKQPSMPQFNTSTQQVAKTPQQEASIGWGVLGFLIPIVGLILFLVWRSDNPQASRYAGIGALVGTIITVIIYVIAGVIAADSMY